MNNRKRGRMKAEERKAAFGNILNYQCVFILNESPGNVVTNLIQ